jgi:hypothetical protein
VSLKIPANDVFVLGVYTNVAKRIYEDPYIYQEVASRTDRRKDLIKRMDGVVEETVKEMLPINQILKTYLNKNAVDVMNGETIEPEAEPMEEEPDMFPGGGEIPVENESYEEPEPEQEPEPYPKWNPRSRRWNCLRRPRQRVSRSETISHGGHPYHHRVRKKKKIFLSTQVRTVKHTKICFM